MHGGCVQWLNAGVYRLAGPSGPSKSGSCWRFATGCDDPRRGTARPGPCPRGRRGRRRPATSIAERGSFQRTRARPPARSSRWSCTGSRRSRSAPGSRAQSRAESRAGDGSRRSSSTPTQRPNVGLPASHVDGDVEDRAAASRARACPARAAASGSAGRAARRAPSASGCPARTRPCAPTASSNARWLKLSRKKPRSSPNTFGSRISTSGKRGRG